MEEVEDDGGNAPFFPDSTDSLLESISASPMDCDLSVSMVDEVSFICFCNLFIFPISTLAFPPNHGQHLKDSGFGTQAKFQTLHTYFTGGVTYNNDCD